MFEKGTPRVTWFKVDDGWYSHPKVMRLSDGAIALFICAGSWSAHHLTDGDVPEYAAPAVRLKPSTAQELVDVGLWFRTEEGFQFENWEQYQPTKASVEKKRSEARDRMAVVRANRENDNGYTAEFDTFWSTYPRKVGKPKAYAAWKKALQRTNPDTIMAGLRGQLAGWDDPAYTPHPTTWLNRDGWDDDVRSAPRPTEPHQSRYEKNMAVVQQLEQMETQRANDVSRGGQTPYGAIGT